MTTNEAGRRLIMEFEGFRADAYLCPAGVWTIGYGHTGDVKPGQRVNEHQAEAILEYDIFRFEQAVTKLAPKAHANEHAALVSFVFNLGIHALETSTLLRAFNQGCPLVAANEFLKWIRAGGKVLPGLVRRRAAERSLFLTVPS